MLILDTLRKFGTDFCRTDQYGKSPREIINILKNSDRSDEFDDKIEQYLTTCGNYILCGCKIGAKF